MLQEEISYQKMEDTICNCWYDVRVDLFTIYKELFEKLAANLSAEIQDVPNISR